MKLCNYQQYYFSRMLSLPSCFHEDKYFNTSKFGQGFEKTFCVVMLGLKNVNLNNLSL